jgi:hypothetical protein
MFSKQSGFGSTLLLVTLVISSLFAFTIMCGCAELSDDKDREDELTNRAIAPEPTSLVLLIVAITCGGLWYLVRRRKY